MSDLPVPASDEVPEGYRPPWLRRLGTLTELTQGAADARAESDARPDVEDPD
ncbi:hypothetical protein [Micromonospora robiginosa]|uniref:Uncharacterized protein n=1 Tax=Micromonospora robiginosa TaxID=2749844 RepID=A0A7L6B305_9ACTN|nr:hypothetical protein [Micromonospora ferruginea]QLQ36352.1 hypothetical protein H1D33_24020 [Micromonospora ferruginea]